MNQNASEPTAVDALLESFSRIPELLHNVVDDIGADLLTTQPQLPEGHPGNSIGWIVWHIGRMEDAQVAAITDAPEVPEDVLDAAARWIAEDVCSWDGECDSGCLGTGDRLARILADAGLLAGTTPEAPKCNLNWWASDELRAELARRGESS